MTFRIFLKMVIKFLLILGTCGVLALGIALCALWFEHKQSLTLPAPAGPFAVGRTSYAWTSNSPDELAPSTEKREELSVWIWYPANAQSSAVRADYHSAGLSQALARAQGKLLTEFLTHDPTQVHVHSMVDPSVSNEQHSYPVVIMRTGLSAPTLDYTTLAEDLASHGYIVVGFDAPYRTIAVVLRDGRVITRTHANNPEDMPYADGEIVANKLVKAWVADVRFILDKLEELNKSDPDGKLTGHLALESVGVFGHSLGGATTAQFCHDDPRCKAGIDIDGAPFGSVVKDGLRQPFMFLLSDHGTNNDPKNNPIAANIQSIYETLPMNTRMEVTIRGSNHFSFTDQILLKSQHVMNGLRRMHVLGPLDGPRGLAITTAFVHTFFDVHLKGEPRSSLDDLQKLYPEVQVEPH